MVMPIRQKLALFAIFGVGLVYATPPVHLMMNLRAHSLPHEQGLRRRHHPHRLRLAHHQRNYDETWVGYTMWLWAAVESDLAIISASAPALKPFFRRYLGGASSAGGNGNGAGAYTRDVEAGRLTQLAGGGVRKGGHGSRGGKEADKMELSLLERRVSETGTEE
jgi:hypothetical protein